jgi:hypothetical protein
MQHGLHPISVIVPASQAWTGIAEATIAALPAAEKNPTTDSLQLLCLLLTLNGGGDHK